jgi:hypothetical protein
VTWKRTVTEERRTIEPHNAQIEKIEAGHRKAVEPTPRPPLETRRLSRSAIAQIALRTLREVFAATPEEMISTVVFNGHAIPWTPLLDAGSSRHSSRCAPP